MYAYMFLKFSSHFLNCLNGVIPYLSSVKMGQLISFVNNPHDNEDNADSSGKASTIFIWMEVRPL